MRKQKAIFIALLLSFVLGLSMVTTGLASLPPPYEKTRTVVLNPNLQNIIKDLQPAGKEVDEDTIATAPLPKPEDNKRAYVIKRGETFAGILQNMGVDPVEVAEATGQMDDHFHLSKLRAGEILNVEMENGTNGKGKHIKNIRYKQSITKTIELFSNDKGEFEVRTNEIKLEKVLLKAKGSINGSFYQSAKNAGVTPSVIGQLISALSYDVDFQRDIQPGHKFTILYEGYTSPEGEFIKSNRPIYVKLEMKKKVVEMYIMQRSDGTLGYFHADGTSARKALLRTPIDGARITSSFGLRRHPILGYTKMHKGVDFGAPQGTPIFAAGDGVVETAGYQNGYGNFVLIRHNDKYETAYGHASRFGPGIRPGVKVRQGQIVAYVGMTGRATGPHLHYEVRVKGSQINPVSVKLPIENKLGGKDLAKFQQQRKEVITALSDAPTRAELAELMDDNANTINDATEVETSSEPTAVEEPKPAETKPEPKAKPAAKKTTKASKKKSKKS